MAARGGRRRPATRAARSSRNSSARGGRGWQARRRERARARATTGVRRGRRAVRRVPARRIPTRCSTRSSTSVVCRRATARSRSARARARRRWASSRAASTCTRWNRAPEMAADPAGEGRRRRRDAVRVVDAARRAVPVSSTPRRRGTGCGGDDRYDRVAAALAPGGTVAFFWNKGREWTRRARRRERRRVRRSTRRS